MHTAKKIVIAGGSGFLGTAISRTFLSHGYEVVVLSRKNSSVVSQERGVRYVVWDAQSVGPWCSELESATALINLTGRSIDCLPNSQNKREIVESRVNSIVALGQGCARCVTPPAAWIQAGAVGIYGDAGDRLCDEETSPGTGFLAETCTVWEQAFEQVSIQARKVQMRIGFVLGKHGGGLSPLVSITKAFLGGSAGGGQQYVSWIHLEDLCQAILFAVTQTQVQGILNLVAPEAVPNYQFMKTLRTVLSRPWCPPAPSLAIKVVAKYILRTNPDLALTGQHCIPKQLTEYGFNFRFNTLEDALRDILTSQGER